MKPLLSALALAILFSSCAKDKKPDESAGNVPDSVEAPDSHAFTSIHHEHQELYNDSAHFTEAQWDKVHSISHQVNTDTGKERHGKFKVFGWHPSYMGSAYKSYDFDLLWGIGYFSYEVNPATGNYKTIYDWRTTDMVNFAKKSGTKVFLTVTNFGSSANSTLLSNPKACATLIDSLVSLLDQRKGDGISVDFESMPGSVRDQFTKFITDLSAALKNKNKNWMLAVALYTVDWNKVFEIDKLNPVVDIYTLMGYDYYYTGSATAGPVSPLASGKTWAPYSLSSSVKYFLAEGAPPEKLSVGLPYYGRSWDTEATTYPSKNLGYINSPAYKDYVRTVQGGKSVFDSVSATFVYPSNTGGKVSQLWYSDVNGLAAKYDYVIRENLGGIGIWALGYDNGRKELWDLLGQKFGK